MTQTIPTLLLTRGLIAAAIVSISACSVYRADKFQGNLLTTQQVASLQVGMNKTQVIQTLGSPMLQDAFNGGRWDYVYRSLKGTGQLEQRVFTVFFDEAGKLARWTGQEAPEINQLTALLKGTPKTPQEQLALKQSLLSAKASPAPANPAKPSAETTQGLAKAPSPTAVASAVTSTVPAAIASPLNAAIAQPTQPAQPAQNVVQLGAAPVLVSAPVPTPVQVALAVPSPAPAFVAAAAPAPAPAPVAIIAAPESAPVIVQAAAVPTPASTPAPVQAPAAAPAALPVVAVVSAPTYAPTSTPAPAPVAVAVGSAAAAQPAPAALAAPALVGNAAASTAASTMADLREEIVLRVNSWRNAWAAKDLSAYSQHYVEGYKGTYDNQMAWLQQRKQVFFNAGNIHLFLRDLKIVPISPNEVRVAFTQSYKSERIHEVGDKNLYLKRVGNEWKIANEKFLKSGEGNLQSGVPQLDKSSFASIARA